MFTTAGDTFASIGASDGNGCPFTALGRVPAAAGSAQASASTTAAIRNDGRRMRGADDMTVPSVLEPVHYRTSHGRGAAKSHVPMRPRRGTKNFLRRPLYRSDRSA